MHQGNPVDPSDRADQVRLTSPDCLARRPVPLGQLRLMAQYCRRHRCHPLAPVIRWLRWLLTDRLIRCFQRDRERPTIPRCPLLPTDLLLQVDLQVLRCHRLQWDPLAPATPSIQLLQEVRIHLCLQLFLISQAFL